MLSAVVVVHQIGPIRGGSELAMSENVAVANPETGAPGAFGWEANEDYTGDSAEHMDSTLDDAETRGVMKGEAGMESDEDAEVRREGGSDTEERLGREEWRGNTKKGP